MKISVIIPAYNEEKYIGKTIQRLLEQEEKAEEIIVVDNNSKDKTAEIANGMGAKVVTETVQGMIPARNRGFNEANYEIIARLDADTLVEKDWIKRIKEDFKDEELVGVSGPAYYYTFPKILQSKSWPFRLYYLAIKRALKHDILFGPNMAIRKSAWEKVKNEVCLDDKKVHEDIDLSIHLAKYGKLKTDLNLTVATSARRWKTIYSFFIEYPIRLRKTLKSHNVK